MTDLIDQTAKIGELHRRFGSRQMLTDIELLAVLANRMLTEARALSKVLVSDPDNHNCNRVSAMNYAEAVADWKVLKNHLEGESS